MFDIAERDMVDSVAEGTLKFENSFQNTSVNLGNNNCRTKTTYFLPCMLGRVAYGLYDVGIGGGGYENGEGVLYGHGIPCGCTGYGSVLLPSTILLLMLGAGGLGGGSFLVSEEITVTSMRKS